MSEIIEEENQNPEDFSKIYNFQGESHTLGNLLQGELLNSKNVEFAGYSVPHPLKDIMKLKIDTKNGVTPDEELNNAKNILDTKFQDLEEKFRKLIK